MEKFVEDLKMMGFSEERAKEAVEKSGGRSVEDAVQWIEDNPQQDGVVASPVVSSDAMTVFFKCEECGKRFDNQQAAGFHAYKTEHGRFSEERGEALPELTDEELRCRRTALMERIKEFKERRKRDEEKTALEEEKKRRFEGKHRGTIRAEMKEVEMRKAVEERRKEKQRDREIREKLLKQIKEDRNAMKSNPAEQQTPPEPKKESNAPKTEMVSNTCKIQVRWPDGRCFNKVFDSSDTLEVVHEYVRGEVNESNSGFTFQSSFPRKKYTAEDQRKSLQELGLCPSACLFVRW